MSHDTEEWCKFWRKLTLGSKNDIRNLVNFDASKDKSENLHFNVLLLPIEYKVSAKKVQRNYFPWHRKKIQTFCLKNGMRNLVNFNASSGKSGNLHFHGILLWKKYNVWAKEIQRSCAGKMTYGFKNDISNLVSFHTSSWN